MFTGQGNIFTPVCHSVHRGAMLQISGGMLQIFRGDAPNFQGGVCSKFSGEGGVCSKFRGGYVPNFGGMLQIFGGVSAPILGGCLLQIFLRVGYAPNF